MKKLILLVHGLGGSKETWGKFPELISSDNKFSEYDVEIYTYPTSLIRPKSIVNPFSALLSLIIPQQKLPTIQDIAKGLKTEIDHMYRDYDTISIVAHSMGGLIAKKYLTDELSLNNIINFKVDKLLLYAVPNHGSNWAVLSKLYSHEQIAQLSKNSDFIESLNIDIAKSNINDKVSIKYVIASQDEVVDKQSAQNEYGNTNQDLIHCGHMDIVKPENNEDISYKIFKHFILEEKIPQNTKIGLTDESTDLLIKTLLHEIMNTQKERQTLTALVQQMKEKI